MKCDDFKRCLDCGCIFNNFDYCLNPECESKKIRPLTMYEYYKYVVNIDEEKLPTKLLSNDELVNLMSRRMTI